MRQLYSKLKKEYIGAFSGDAPVFSNPIKQSIVLKETKDGNPDKFLNIMASRLSNGACGAKVIHVDESTGNMKSYTVLFDKDGTPKIVDSAELTRLRCGLMAALCIDLFFGPMGKCLSELKVGFIGTGRTNIKTADALSQIFGINDFACTGSPSNPAKNVAKFARLGSVTFSSREGKYEALKDCDVIISCTNTTDPNHVIEYQELKGPLLFIAQDGGYIFGESFRNGGVSFSDYPTQILAAAHHEFPWDLEKPTQMFPITRLTEYNTLTDYPRVAYLYGVALADLVVAGGME